MLNASIEEKNAHTYLKIKIFMRFEIKAYSVCQKLLCYFKKLSGSLHFEIIMSKIFKITVLY